MTGRERLRTGAGIALLAMLGACGTIGPRTQPAKPAPPPVNLSGYNAAFKAGYTDGCSSAGGSSQRRDDSRYKTDTDYMMGWNDGFSVCGKRR
jgi:hypothetical protein